MARRENLTIRQLYERVVGIRAHRVVAGTPGEIADDMEAWHKAGAADGFNILFLTRIEKTKGIYEAIAAYDLLKKKFLRYWPPQFLSVFFYG